MKFDVILNQSECTHLCNHLSNYILMMDKICCSFETSYFLFPGLSHTQTLFSSCVHGQEYAWLFGFYFSIFGISEARGFLLSS